MTPIIVTHYSQMESVAPAEVLSITKAVCFVCATQVHPTKRPGCKELAQVRRNLEFLVLQTALSLFPTSYNLLLACPLHLRSLFRQQQLRPFCVAGTSITNTNSQKFRSSATNGNKVESFSPSKSTLSLSTSAQPPREPRSPSSINTSTRSLTWRRFVSQQTTRKIVFVASL